MSGFLTSRWALAAAWIVVVTGLAAALNLAFLLPRPPATSEPATVTLSLAAPPTEVAEASAGETPPPATASVELPQPSAEPQEAQGEAATTAQETPDATRLPEPASEASDAPVADAGAEHAPEAAASTTGQDDPPPTEAPEAVAALQPPPAKPEPPAADSGENHGQTGGESHDEASGASGEQQVAIPKIPPALEQLPTWERYRQPFNMDDKRPRIAVVLTGLGLSDGATEAAINQLPAAVTLSFSPYARDLERWIALARSRGHEVMLDLPMEPATFPNEDPGPQGLLVGLSAEENLNRLDWVLSRGSAYVGLAGAMGSRFTASRDSVEPVLREVKDRGLIFLDRRTTENSLVPALAQELGLPSAINNRSVDERQASRVAIDARLAQIERIALTEGFAVAMAQPYPVTLDRLAEWSTEITSRGFALAPISALADLQTAP